MITKQNIYNAVLNIIKSKVISSDDIIGPLAAEITEEVWEMLKEEKP